MLDGPADGAVDGSDGAALSAEQPASLLAVPLPLELPSEAEPLQEPLPAPEQETEPEPLPEPKPEPTAVSEPQPQPEAEPEPEPTPQPRPDPEPVVTADVSALAPALPPRISAADILASRHAEIERLTARIDAQGSAAASRARRKAISTSTREYRYSSYMEAWRRKVERIGNLNYPEEAARQGLFGALILHVAVRADGSLEGVRVVRSSGHAVLDQAAIRIVQLAAPYAPFPDDIAAETDVLDITRTWQFQRNNRLGWDN
ncbi:energy transducer TonB [Thiohalocapsa marina]|uniref:Energy transducer TonB n=2 Tax=Thiohalocapsa marina TaxID=424902 RepID=A0A5M8FP18_9GAMM|nr:energy transducer TonB [Thiohalocapsa marina]